jgi:hypothetical protein
MQIFAQQCGPALWINPNTGKCDQTTQPQPLFFGCDPVNIPVGAYGYGQPQCQDVHPPPIIPADSYCAPGATTDQYGNPCPSTTVTSPPPYTPPPYTPPPYTPPPHYPNYPPIAYNYLQPAAQPQATSGLQVGGTTISWTWIAIGAIALIAITSKR